MAMPPLLSLLDEAGLPDEAAYRAHFEATYCKAPILTFDGIAVRFSKNDFDHCCYKTERGGYRKTNFCPIRGSRVDWIKATLEDPDADLRVGWDNSRRKYLNNRRVSIVSGSYVVVIDIMKDGKTAELVTTFVADSGPGQALALIKKSPKWLRKQT